MLGRGEEAPAAATRPRSSPTRWRRVIGTVFLSCGMPAASTLRAPPTSTRSWSRRPPSGPASTGRRACRSCGRRGSLGVPEYRVDEEGPDHEKKFPARAVFGDEVLGEGGGRSKKEAEQKAAKEAWHRARRAPCRLRGRRPSPTPTGVGLPPARMPELPEVEVVRRGLQDHVVGRTIARRRVQRRAGGPPPRAGPARPRRPADGQPVAAGPRRGKYLWLVLRRPDGHEQGLIIHLGMSGQMLVEPPGRRRGEALPRPVRLRRRRPAAAVRRPAHLRRPGARRPRRPTASPRRSRHIAPDPFEPGLRPGAPSCARMKPREQRGQAGAARPDAGLGHRQHLRRRGAVAGPGARRAALLRAHQAGAPPLLDHAREVMVEALGQGGTSFDALYVNVNGAVGLLRPVAATPTARRAGRADRCGTPIRREQFMNRSSYSCPRCQPRPRTLRR